MIKIDIPGLKKIDLKYLILDFNGTLAKDGILINGVKEKLINLSGKIEIYVVTADTFGLAGSELKSVPCQLTIIDSNDQAKKKEKFIKRLGKKNVCAVGNGFNDNLMVKNAALGISVIQEEGASSVTILNSHIICKSVLDALELLENPKRISATLRR